ncbi:3D-(3,5/4)-trihydroxycyclohexane-1,2-dione acylhydrolase (decyclizing) [Pseudoalteromonas sp. 5-MNA-CIBAN-0065]|uniref:3D-(3,5/4)-trihydroxycyclohexane-1,2-dione acylhydrolase (decyclizing) n=1 Tax=Pseudoalteromonas sp. 5-MNA-CIBAN-0065 TaxID=3140421 RepID=UPI00332A5327|tara:strand:+ start:11245 stop:13101 length:1857 start_codon:yes stop_codon:yes gene_type:complete
MKTIRLTAAQALIKYLQQQYLISETTDGQPEAIFTGAFAIFGHGNVAGIGEALYQERNTFPTYRAHNEQGMAHAAIAFAKQHNRRKMMMCTTSIGPGATNMVTAAGLAHVNRLPILFVPGDTFANRVPDPVLQQVECFSDPTISVNDCFKPVSRYFDRINRPEQLINSLPVVIQTLLDPVNCGPVTLAIPQDVQTMAFDYPAKMFEKRIHRIRRPGIENSELEQVIALLRKSSKPLIIAGGGVHYSLATETLAQFADAHKIPVAETQAGKGSLNWQHPYAVGGIGVTGSKSANSLARQADLIIAIGSRLQDFTTESRTLFEGEKTKLVQINVGQFDANKHDAIPLQADAKIALQHLTSNLSDWQSSPAWSEEVNSVNEQWREVYQQVTADTDAKLPSDAQVLGAVKRQSDPRDVVVCAAGGLPGDLHKLWRCDDNKSYHVEYGFSCMGYEIAGGLGVKMASPDRDVFVVVGDGSYMMMNSELATSVMMGQKIIVIVLDNRGYGCINRLQMATGNEPFNNLLEDCHSIDQGAPKLDFAAHAKAMGAQAESVSSIAALEQAIQRAKQAERSYLIAIDTDPYVTTCNGNSWWDVAIPEVSVSEKVNLAQQSYQQNRNKQPY